MRQKSKTKIIKLRDYHLKYHLGLIIFIIVGLLAITFVIMDIMMLFNF